MALYVQKIALMGRERWIGWDIDGVGTEIPGLTLAEGMSEGELLAKGVKEFRAMSFESFLGLGAAFSGSTAQRLLDEDVDFRLDALLVGMERYRCGGITDIPRSMLIEIFGDERHLTDSRIQQRFVEWQERGSVQVVGGHDCYLRVVGRIA